VAGPAAGSQIVTAYIGQGSPRFYLAMAPELPDPICQKVILTDSETSREALKLRLREAVANGLAPEARVRVTQLVFGPYSPSGCLARDGAGCRTGACATSPTGESRCRQAR
jgi:hypothetical protein